MVHLNNSKRNKVEINIVNKLLYESKRTCCICRDSTKPIAIHHINAWSKSHDNSEKNLVVLCIEHHDEAHTKRGMSLNLKPTHIKSAKKKWLQFVRDTDLKGKTQNSVCYEQNELINIIKAMAITNLDEVSCQPWTILAGEGTPISWITEGIKVDENNGFKRDGFVSVRINNKPYYILKRTLEPLQWRIELFGPRAGVNGYKLTPGITSYEIDHTKIIEYLKKNNCKLKLLASDKDSKASYGNELYMCSLPKCRHGYLILEYEYASAGGNVCLTYYYEKPTEDVIKLL